MNLNYKLLNFFLSLFLIFSHHISFSQIASSPTKIGLKGGLSLSRIKGTEVNLYRSNGAKLKNGIGPVLGIILVSQFKNRRLAFKTEVNYITKGAKLPGGGFYGTHDKTAGYLQLPVMISYDLIPSPRISLSVEAGGALNYAVKPIKFNPEYYTEPKSIKTPKLMVSPVAGLNIQLDNSLISPFLSIRYDFDNQKYFTRTAGDSEYYIEHSGTASFFVGVLFDI